MSSYLLLRNNKESGPFTIDEIREMPLKTYDLLWVVGKSAAWKYPGEIPEIKPFAPPVPDQIEDSYRKVKSDNLSLISRDSAPQKVVSSLKSVYVNLPSEKKNNTVQRERFIVDQEYSDEITPAISTAELYTKKQSRSVRISGKILWICTITLLFGAGLLTGFVISDRGNIFSKDDIHPQNGHLRHSAILAGEKESVNKNEILAPDNANSGMSNMVVKNTELTSDVTGLSKTKNAEAKKNVLNSGKKKPGNATVNKDSALVHSNFISASNVNDSLKKTQAVKPDVLYQKIQAHPENYIDLVTGRYTTGVFGGISSFPVTVTNNSTILIDQVVISIDYIQNNDKIFKTEKLYFTGLEPGETVTIKAPKSSRGVKVTTHVLIANPGFQETGVTN
jgi:hypothetical protein